jgi:hypothetical protein
LDNIAAYKDEIAAIEHQKAFLKEIGVGKSRQISKDLDVQRPLLDDWKSVLEFLGRNNGTSTGSAATSNSKFGNLRLTFD